jgi:nitrogenase molybdenum-iron protein beta chain
MSQVTEYPRGTCVLGGLNAAFSAIKRVCTIYHSGPGCAMQTTAGESFQSGLLGSYYLGSVSSPCSNMLEREVVFGGEGKLRDEIDGSLEIIEADAYFVLTGCTAGIIGDDIEAVVSDYSEKGFPVYPVTTPGFAGDSLLGYEVAFETLFEHIINKKPKRDETLVNLIGIIPYHDAYWSGNFEELTRILQKLGLRVNTFFSDNQGIEHVKTASSAALNIIVDPWLLKGFVKKMEDTYGVSSVRFPGVPVGATQTSAFVRGVGKALNFDEALIERVVHEGEAYVYHYYESSIGILGWKRFSVVGDAGTAIAFTKFLANDCSFTPVVIIVTEPIWQDDDRAYITKQIQTLEYAKSPDVFFLPDHYDVRQKIKEYEGITLLAGSSLEQEVAIEIGAQHNTVSYPISDRLIMNRTYAGYKGAVTIVEDLFNNL